MKSQLRSIFAAALALTAAACASQPTGPLGTFESIGPSPMAMAAAATPPEQYRLGAFDKIAVNVYQMPELSSPEIQIDSTGQIILPQIGPVAVLGKTVPEVTVELKDKLRQCCLVNPEVIVTLREAVSQQITVSGAVRTPNNYPIRGRTTLMQAIAMANGPDQATADLRTVGVIRNFGAERRLAKYDLEAISRGQAADPEILPGDVIFVETSGSKSAFRNAVSAVPFFGVFTLF